MVGVNETSEERLIYKLPLVYRQYILEYIW